jgi:ATP-dependent helicase/nuclease subunit B
MAFVTRVATEIAIGDPWPKLVRRAIDWADEQRVALRDAVVLLPFAQHLPLARRAWAQPGGWMPRIETTQTLARSLAPGAPAEAGQISFDASLDRLTARRLLRSQSAAAAWARRDLRAFDLAVAAVVKTAHAIARAAAAVRPEDRAAYWDRGRRVLALPSGPDAIERLLARVAFEWAAAGAVPATDVLYALQPAAWIVVQAGGADALSAQLVATAAPCTPCLWLDTDAPIDDPFSIAQHAVVDAAACADFEAESQRTAALVLRHVAEGRTPVALIAQDRSLVRRVRALLSRRRLPLLDETGWKLSTTRAGAAVIGVLRAARSGASNDEWLDWLKSCTPQWPSMPDAPEASARLEHELRHKGWVVPHAVNVALLPDRAAVLWRSASTVVSSFTDHEARPLDGWLLALRRALQACGTWRSLELDDAGRQVVAALHLSEPPIADPDAMTFDEFSAWVDEALEDAAFRPEPRIAAAAAPVVITPLERAMLRPFAAVVLPGADEKRLGAPSQPHALLDDALAAELGLPASAARRDAETLAFAQLLRCKKVTLLWRVDDVGEPLGASPLLQRLSLSIAQAGAGDMAEAPDASIPLEIVRRGVQRPMPSAPDLLPAQLSASACEALRACPYRFFALRMLSLKEVDELDGSVEKRDYGNWLHKVLWRFHTTRDAARAPVDERAELHRIALEIQQELRLDDAAFLPYAASFARFVTRYIEWLHARDLEGARWLEGELKLKAMPPAWAGTEMVGVLDRIDSANDKAGPITQLIDYKTANVNDLRKLQKPPQEDTQLAFYAALASQQPDAPARLSAMYLALDDSEGIKEIPHEEVSLTARQLIEGIGRELGRVREGVPMPALGEGRTCEFCEARGLCRRDHWAAPGDIA